MTHSQQQQSSSGLRSPERSSSSYFYFLLAKRPFARWRQTHYKYQNPLDSRVNAVMWSVDYSYKDAKMHKSGRVQPLLSSNINSQWTGFQTRLFFRRGQKGNTQRKPNSIIVFLFIQNNPSFKNKLKHAYLHRPSMLSSSSIACLSASLGDCSVLQIFSKIADQKMIEILLIRNKMTR